MGTSRDGYRIPVRPLALTLVFALIGSGRVDASEAPSPGRTLTRQLFVQERDREVEHLVYLPAGHDPARAYPLIVGLHGTAGNPRQILDYPGLRALADARGYVLLCPSSSGVAGLDWRGQPSRAGSVAGRYVMHALADTRRAVRVDPDRVYLLGVSRGGGGVWSLGLRHPAVWAALAPISPALGHRPNALPALRDVPVLMIQGTEDRAIRTGVNRRWAKAMARLGMTHRFVEIEGAGHDLEGHGIMPMIVGFFDRHERRGRRRSHPADGSETRRSIPVSPPATGTTSP